MSRRARRPWGPPGFAPSVASIPWTSSGKTRWETPRFRMALLQARLTNSECRLVWSTV